MSDSDLLSQSNELGNQPKVSNDPSTRLPEATKGQINIISSNPEVEQKRRVNHYQTMRGNTYALRSGKYSKLHPTPEYLLDYMGYVDDLQFDQPREIVEFMARIIKSNLKRVTLKEHLELSDGEVGNKQLTQMMKDTFTMAQAIGHFRIIQKTQIHNQQFDNQDVLNLTDDERIESRPVNRDLEGRAASHYIYLIQEGFCNRTVCSIIVKVFIFSLIASSAGCEGGTP